MASHSSVLAWRIPWTEEPGGLQSIESQTVGHDLAQSTICIYMILCYAICIFVYNLLLPNSLNRSNMHSENILYSPKSRDLKINLRPNNGKSNKISVSWGEELGRRRARTQRILGSENTLI